jgi:indoleamine 2,3-dioxygenase
MTNLNALILAGKLRQLVIQLPELIISDLNEKQLQRAYVVLSFISQAYLVGFPHHDPVLDILPRCLAVPWFDVSCRLEIKPSLSYAAVDLWNYKVLSTDPISFGNIGIHHTFSGCFDEAWFFLIPLGMELAGAPAIPAIIEAKMGIESNSHAKVAVNLGIIADSVEKMSIVFQQMRDKNDPHIFWNRVRPYAGGSKNALSLPNGIFYEGVATVRVFLSRSMSMYVLQRPQKARLVRGENMLELAVVKVHSFMRWI